MQETNEMRDRLINEFAENYMEKLFYFCLKKTGSHIEAEDLTQDIALQIITALNKGTILTSFSAWVWQIARNRYSVWAKAKHSRNESVTGSDIGDYEIEDESESILDEMIHTEQKALLRRELAFIKSDYRNIVVAYYIENKNVREIAESLSLPTNTVKSRLLRAREILKEGMDMAREFGKLSYNPENIAFWVNGLHGANGEPGIYVSRSLSKNIMLAAYRTPATAEELAMEVGVALPYSTIEILFMIFFELMGIPYDDPFTKEQRMPPKYEITSPYFAQEAINNDRYCREIRLMSWYELHTTEDVTVFRDKRKAELQNLERERKAVDNRRRRLTNPDEKQKNSTERSAITKKMTNVRREMNLADDILSDSIRLAKVIAAEKACEERLVPDKSKQKHKEQER